MSGVSEVKCPHCGEWTTRHGRVDDKCHNCNGYIEPHRFSADAEKKAHKAKNPKQADFFPVKKGDGPVTQEVKGFINAFGWIVFYSEVAFYISVVAVIAILGFIAG
jgi:hypothetical protein